ncbi:MAG TPA: hypothetical protein VN200_09115 [Rhodoglobus sp.]|nr:hypothetical protein [Rhodoglobus sp.]
MIDWMSFVIVVVASMIAACGVVTLFSLGLRLADGTEPWRRPVAVVLFGLCAVAVAAGIYLIVPALHGG